MAAIEGYEQRIGVNAGRGVIRPQLPEYADIGPAFGALGRTIMDSQEPRLRAEADKAAIEAAGQAKIVKDEAGNFVRPPMPPGGGRRYIETYERVMRERHAAAVTSDFEVELDRLSTEHFMDAEGFMSAANGRAEGILAAIPSDIRPEVETVLAREVSERFRGIGHRQASNDRQVLVAGLVDTMNQNDAKGLDVLKLGGADAEARAAPFFAAAERARHDMLQLGEMNQASIDAGELRLSMNADENVRYARSLDNGKAITGRLATLSTPELKTLELWGAGVATDPSDKVLGFTFDTFSAAFPERSGELRRRVGVVAGGIANERLAEQRRQEEIDRQERRAAEDRAALTAAIQSGFDANYTYDDKQRRALDNHFLSYMGVQPTTPVDQFMSTPEGRRKAVAFAAQTGYMPTSVRDYIESRIYSAGAPAVAELAQNIRNATTNEGVSQGYRLFETLSPKTRAAVYMIERLRRGGENEGTISARVDAFLKARSVTDQEVESRFVGPKGEKLYNSTRDAAIRTQLGMDASERIPAPVQQDFDEMLRWNLDIFDGDATRATKESARQVAAGWKRSPVFLGGVGPASFLSLPGLQVQNLDEAFIHGGHGQPPARRLNPRVSFAPGAFMRAKLETLDIGPTAGLGRYRVHVYNHQNQEVLSYDVDADVRLAPVLQRTRRATGQAEINRARQQREQMIRQSRQLPPTSGEGFTPNDQYRPPQDVEFGD